MALRLTAANSEYLTITSGLLDHNDNYTVAGWVYFVSLIAAAHILDLAASAGYDDFDALWVNYDGNALAISAFNAGGGGDDLAGSTTLSAGVWYHLALTRHSKTSLTCRVNGAADALSVTTDVTGRSATDRIEFGRYVGVGNYNDCRIRGWKAWQRVLTDAELLTEMKRDMPFGPLSLYASWPFAPGARAFDLSGRGHHWTEINTPTDEVSNFIEYSDTDLLVGVPSAAPPGGSVVPMVQYHRLMQGIR